MFGFIELLVRQNILILNKNLLKIQNLLKILDTLFFIW